MMLATIGIGRELLATVLEPAHGAAAAHGEPGEAYLLSGQNRLVTEAAADIGGDDPDLHFWDLQDLGKTGAHDVRKLGCAVQHKLTKPRVPLGDEAAALDRRHHLARGAQLSRHLDRCGARHSLHVTIVADLDEEVAPDRVVHLRSARSAGLAHVDDRGQLLVFEAHLRGDVLSLAPAVCDCKRDQLADLADTVAGEHRLLGSLEPRQRGNRPDRQHPGQILRGEYACAQMRGDVNAGQPRMRNGAAHECDLAHSRQPDVADILATAVQKAIILLAEKPRTNRFSAGAEGTGCGAHQTIPRRCSAASTVSARACGRSFPAASTSSACSGGSYALPMPVKFGSLPARASL